MSKYTNLRDRTILDFCTYEEFCEATGSCCRKEDFVEGSKNAVQNAWGMLHYAEATHNKEFAKAIRNQLKDELARFFNE